MKLPYFLLLTLLLAACTHQVPESQLPPEPPPTDLSQTGLATLELADNPAALDSIDLSDINLSGGELLPPGFKLNFDQPNQAGQSDLISLLSGRVIPVTAKDSQEIVGWRIVGELVNHTGKTIADGQLVISLTPAGQTEVRTLLPQALQPGGVLPIPPATVSVYDVLLRQVEEAENISIGLRPQENPAKKSLRVTNLNFTKRVTDTRVSFIVRGRVTNDSDELIRDPVVQFWAVVTAAEAPPGAKTKDQVVAVGSWLSAQEVLGLSQSREFETVLTPLTIHDKELMESGQVGLSAIAGGTVIEK